MVRNLAANSSHQNTVTSFYVWLKCPRSLRRLAILTDANIHKYGCETWSLTLRDERKLRVFENMALRRILGPRRDEVTGEWRRFYNEELNDLYWGMEEIL